MDKQISISGAIRKYRFKFEEAQKLVEGIEKPEWRDHQWYDATGKPPIESGHSTVYFTEPNSRIYDILNKSVESVVQSYCEDVLGEHQDLTEFSNVRINRFLAGDDMAIHVDHIRTLFLPADKKGIPVLSIVGLLTNDFEGGSLFIRDKDMKLKAGEIIVFPSVFLYPHYVSPVIKGERHSFVSWAW